MAIDKIHAQVIGSIWQAFSQSGVDLSAVPADQQQKLVAKIAENVLLTVDAAMEEAAPKAAPVEPADDEFDEKVLWEGRPFLSLVESYVLTSERLKIRTGLMARNIENFELIRIQDLDYKQGVTERMLAIGDIHIKGHDPSDPEIVLRNVSKPEEVYEILRRAWLDARKRHGLQFREYM